LLVGSDAQLLLEGVFSLLGLLKVKEKMLYSFNQAEHNALRLYECWTKPFPTLNLQRHKGKQVSY